MHNSQVPAAARLRSPVSPTPIKTPCDQLVTFEIEADHCPQVLLRVLGLMTRDGTIPVTVAVRRTEDAILIAVGLDGATANRCDHLRQRIEEVPTVRTAILSPKAAEGPRSASAT